MIYEHVRKFSFVESPTWSETASRNVIYDDLLLFHESPSVEEDSDIPRTEKSIYQSHNVTGNVD